jgi:hemoglobin
VSGVPVPTAGVQHSTETPYAQLGGESAVRALVDRFYDLMDLEPAYAVLRSLHPPNLEASRDKLFWFLCGWLGGPNHYVERRGHPMLRARHLPFSIGSAERDEWMSCMAQALAEQQVPDALRERLLGSLFQTADWMRNRTDS